MATNWGHPLGSTLAPEKSLASAAPASWRQRIQQQRGGDGARLGALRQAVVVTLDETASAAARARQGAGHAAAN